jgi:hypothetical protein
MFIHDHKFFIKRTVRLTNSVFRAIVSSVMSKKHVFDESMFHDTLELAVDVFAEHLETEGFTDDQAEALKDEFQEKLSEFLETYIEDLPIPEDVDEEDDEEDY